MDIISYTLPNLLNSLSLKKRAALLSLSCSFPTKDQLGPIDQEKKVVFAETYSGLADLSRKIPFICHNADIVNLGVGYSLEIMLQTIVNNSDLFYVEQVEGIVIQRIGLDILRLNNISEKRGGGRYLYFELNDVRLRAATMEDNTLFKTAIAIGSIVVVCYAAFTLIGRANNTKL